MRLDMNLHRWAATLERHPGKNHRVVGARGVRKTTALYQIVTLRTLQHPWPGVGTYTAPYRNQCKSLVWDQWIAWLDRQRPSVMAGKPNATDLNIPLIRGKSLQLIGLDKFDRKGGRRGWHPVANGNDEAARSKPDAIEIAVGLGLDSHDAWNCDITNPNGHNWWEKQRFNEGLDPTSGVISWRIPMRDTGLRSRAWLEEKRRKLRPSQFAEEVEAEFSGTSGPVFPDFSEQMWPNGHLVTMGQARGEMAKGGYLIGALDWAYDPEWAHMLWLWITKAGGLIVLKEFRYQRLAPRQAVEATRKERGLPPMTALDSGCWSQGKLGEESIAKQLERAGLRVKKANKRFEDSLLKLNGMLSLEGVEGFPNFAIVEGEAPFLIAEMTSLGVTDKRAGHGFANHVSCNGVDALRYGAMSFGVGEQRETVITTIERPRGPLIPWKSGQARAPHHERLVGVNPLTGNPRWG